MEEIFEFVMIILGVCALAFGVSYMLKTVETAPLNMINNLQKVEEIKNKSYSVKIWHDDGENEIIEVKDYFQYKSGGVKIFPNGREGNGRYLSPRTNFTILEKEISEGVEAGAEGND